MEVWRVASVNWRRLSCCVGLVVSGVVGCVVVGPPALCAMDASVNWRPGGCVTMSFVHCGRAVGIAISGVVS